MGFWPGSLRVTSAPRSQVPGVWTGTTALNGEVAPWTQAQIGALYLYKASATDLRVYMKVADAAATTSWVVINSTQQVTGFIDIPLATLREMSSGDIINTAGDAGMLSKNTTPILEKVNGATDGAMRLNWASSNSDALTFQFAVPPDLDDTKDVLLKVSAAMQGVTDTPTIAVKSFWGFGDTAVDDATGAVTGTTIATYTATIAADDVDAANTCTINLTPGAHATASHALYVYALWIEYTKK